ncbi:MAG: hypothetical protein AAGC55_11375, partial [Myxococcota bacterium]
MTARAALALALAAIMLGDARPLGAEPGAGPDGYDHLWHQGRVAAAALPELPCTHCHPIDRRAHLRGQPGHSACFGACHGPPPPRRTAAPYTIAAAVRRVCNACHPPRALDQLIRPTADSGVRPGRSAQPVPVYWPAPGRGQTGREHGLALSHRAHSAVPRGCQACHSQPAPRRSPPSSALQAASHARCTGCHPATAPGAATPARPPGAAAATAPGRPMPMTECQRCHVPTVGPDSRPHLRRGRYPVGAVFSHRTHHDRGARDCLLCHRAVTATDDRALPAPTTEV